ncbi:sodium/glutamate symporter [Rubritalea tangerina]|uniref:Sodium/glutamate symporter n=1 Tax=Rubritalea tangerina TaxID=430798 RepID=A0ABW4Z937_9BACT
MDKHLIEIETFITYTLGILVFFIGMQLTQRIKFLREYNIPEPVTGGIIASLVSLVLYLLVDVELNYNLEFRDILLVYFFTTIGINARFSDLINGGRPLLILLTLTLGYIVIQNIVGVSGAMALGQPKAMGVLTGSASLIGGHGTAIAWSSDIAKEHGISNALEIGVASATMGLVMASLLGGPISKWLIQTFKLKGSSAQSLSVGVSYENENIERITHVSLMQATFAIHIAIIVGFYLNDWVNALGVKLPLFVSCLLVAIFLSNTIPLISKKIAWPARTRAIAVISDFSLGLFIAMSLMGMQLWTIADLASSLLILLAAQAVSAIIFIRFLLFPLMGRDYQASVLSAGFAGFSLGATPTAIANMTAVTKTHGPAPTAFIILPLVGAFFVDLANAFIIRYFLNL